MRSAYREMFVALSERHVTESTQFAAVEQGAEASGDITDIRGLTESQILAITALARFAIAEILRSNVSSGVAVSKAAATSPDTAKSASPSVRTLRTTPC